MTKTKHAKLPSMQRVKAQIVTAVADDIVTLFFFFRANNVSCGISCER